MDFDNRQYDPQLARFLCIDPLAALGGQDMYSPYAAMGNMPEMLIDPNGLMAGFEKDNPMGINTTVGGGFSNYTGIAPIGGSAPVPRVKLAQTIKGFYVYGSTIVKE